MAEIDMLAYGKKKGRPSKAMKNMPKYDDNFDANARRKGVTNKNFNKAEIDKLVKARVKAEVDAKMDEFTRKDWVPKQKPSVKASVNYGRITDTQYPDTGLKYNNSEVAKYSTMPRVMDASPAARSIRSVNGDYSVNTSGTDALTNMTSKSRAGVPAEKLRLPPVMSKETFDAGNIRTKLPAIPTAAEQAVATTAMNLDNAKKVSAMGKLKNVAGGLSKKVGGKAGALASGYGGFDIGQRIAGGLAGVFTDDEAIINAIGTAGGVAGGAAATMVPALRLPTAVYGAVKGATDVYDMIKEPSKADQQIVDEVAMQQASPTQPSTLDMLIADLLAGKGDKGGKSKSDDALATMLALANQGTAEANARAKRLAAMDEAGMLDVDILK